MVTCHHYRMINMTDEKLESVNDGAASVNAAAEVVNVEPKAKVCRMRGALLDESMSSALDRVLQYRSRTLKAQMERWIELEMRMIIMEDAATKMTPVAIGRLA